MRLDRFGLDAYSAIDANNLEQDPCEKPVSTFSRHALEAKCGATRPMNERLSDEEHAALCAELERLRQEHRDLDAAIEALGHLATSDRLQIQRLKKRKLILRDRIAELDDQLTPDIIA
jgi:hypothetical protein